MGMPLDSIFIIFRIAHVFIHNTNFFLNFNLFLRHDHKHQKFSIKKAPCDYNSHKGLFLLHKRTSLIIFCLVSHSYILSHDSHAFLYLSSTSLLSQFYVIISSQANSNQLLASTILFSSRQYRPMI